MRLKNKYTTPRPQGTWFLTVLGPRVLLCDGEGSVRDGKGRWRVWISMLSLMKKSAYGDIIILLEYGYAKKQQFHCGYGIQREGKKNRTLH